MKRNSIISKIDWVVILLYLVLVTMGWINIYSAVSNGSEDFVFSFGYKYGRQLIWILVSVLTAFFILIFDSKFFVSFGYVFYAFFMLLLIAVLILGKEVNGARSWFDFGGFRFQPAELAKFGTALAVSKLVSSFNFNLSKQKYQFRLLLLLLIPVSLIILQNDTGSALVYVIFVIPLFREGLSGLILFFGVLMAMLFIFSLIYPPVFVLAGIIAGGLIAFAIIKRSYKILMKPVLLFITVGALFFLIFRIFLKDHFNWYNVVLYSSLTTAIALFIFSIIKRIPQAPLVISIFLMSVVFTFGVDFAFHNMLEEHHRERINNLLGVESDPLGAGYNVNQSKIAIGSGGVTGKGFLQGTQTRFEFVPEQSTDFIFCTVGEEWGFMGTSVVIIIYLFFIIRIIILAERQRSVFSRFYGYSVASIFFFHFTINIGMTIGLAPVIGIPLPFFSYGGSSLWFFTILLFVFIKLDTSRLELIR